VKNKNQETDGYGRDKRPKTEKLKRKEITITENWNNHVNPVLVKSTKIVIISDYSDFR